MFAVYILPREIFHLWPKIDQKRVVIAGGGVNIRIQTHVA